MSAVAEPQTLKWPLLDNQILDSPPALHSLTMPPSQIS